MRDSWLDEKILITKKFGLAALFGVAAIIVGLLLPERWLLPRIILFVSAVVLSVPFVVYLNMVTIWHWKRRYRGKKSDLWGAILLIETSGWFKVVYWFRHILPDWRGKGRYAAD